MAKDNSQKPDQKPEQNAKRTDSDQAKPTIDDRFTDDKLHRDNDFDNIPESKTKSPDKFTSHKTKLWLALAVLLALGAAIGLVYLAFGLNRGGEPEPESTAPAEVQEAQPILNFNQFENIYYAHGPDFDQAGAVYSRPFGGGDRSQLQTLASLENITTLGPPHVATSQVYAYIHNQKEIWLGQNGEEPQKIYTLDRGDQFISGLVPNYVGDRLAFVTVPTQASVGSSASPKVSLWTMNSDGSNLENVVDNTHQDGPFWLEPFQWSSDNRKLFLRADGYPTDGPGPAPQALNLETDEQNQLTPTEGYQLAGFAVNASGSHVAYLQTSQDESQPFGYGAPYTLRVRNLDTQQEQKVETFSDSAPQIAWYINDQNKLAYASGTKLFTYDLNTQNSQTSFDTTGPKINTLYVVSNTQALFSEHQSSSNVAYHSVDLEAKSSQEIMTGTEVTELIGVTFSE